MSRPTELLDLFEIDLRYRRVSWVDGFQGMKAVVRYLRDQADREQCYSVGGFSGEIKAVAFFRGDNLLMLTSAGEVVSG